MISLEKKFEQFFQDRFNYLLLLIVTLFSNRNLQLKLRRQEAE